MTEDCSIDPYELSEDLLDAIAYERDVELASMHARCREADALANAGSRDEAGRLSIQAEQHKTAYDALRRALDRCQRIKDNAFEGLT